MKQRPSMEKRRKERARQERQQEKAERRERRKAEKLLRPPGWDPTMEPPEQEAGQDADEESPAGTPPEVED